LREWFQLIDARAREAILKGLSRLRRPLWEIQHVATVTVCFEGSEEESRPTIRSEAAKESKATWKELDSYLGEGLSQSNSPFIPKNVKSPKKQRRAARIPPIMRAVNRAPTLPVLSIEVKTEAEPIYCDKDWDSGTATFPPALAPGVPSLSNVDEGSQLPRRSRNCSRQKKRMELNPRRQLTKNDYFLKYLNSRESSPGGARDTILSKNRWSDVQRASTDTFYPYARPATKIMIQWLAEGTSTAELSSSK
ncbi:hypothetical protein TSAR_002507, partial [Trichomalopsis sarcophagae]